ncbi:GDCCVxC domain-containing (seleno)protein [Paraburkholderia sp. UCT70]|uniref:GDCCVxC domain-containing (seleno)protein n=1 Tax=Paraburkholderia sp. UCT70 TaxID=2991068 RepID=UPI003D1CA3E7
MVDFDRRIVTVSNVVLASVLSCPQCGTATPEIMPTDACQFYYECPACHALLRPKPGDCCVFCSFGAVPCPPVQYRRACCEPQTR